MTDPFEQAYDEFCEAWLEGEHPDKEAVCTRFPDREQELRARIEKFVATYKAFEETRNGRVDTPGRSGKDFENIEGKVLGDFQLLKEIGRGGMGVVYEARQVSLDRIVSLKVLPAHLTLRKDAIARFRREASTASKLKHSGIVEIHSIGEAEGNHFFVMELVEGAPLDKVIERLDFNAAFPLGGRHFGAAVKQVKHLRSDHVEPEKQKLHAFWDKTYIEVVCRVIAQVADTLYFAHKAGVIHRDVKPSNILIREDGSVVLTDFGLAREEGLPSLSVTGELAGTPHYLAPEQASPKRRNIDNRVDIYSLGVSLYECLTLTRPYDGKTSQEVLSKIVAREPAMPRSKNVMIPKDLETICLTALEKDPGNRYQDAKAFEEDLLSFLEFGPIKARPVGAVARTYRMVRRNPAYSAISVLLFLVLFVGPLIFGIQQRVANVRVQKALAAKEEALEKAEREEATAKQVSDFLATVFTGSDPFLAKGETVTAYDLLHRGSASLETQLKDQPEVLARLMSIIGSSYSQLGYYDEAEELLQKTVETYRRELGEDHELTVSATYQLGRLYLSQGRTVEADPLLTAALENAACAHHETCDHEEHDMTLVIKEAIGRKFMIEENYKEAEQIFLQIIDEVYRDPANDECRALGAMYELGCLYMYQGMNDEAEALFTKCIDSCLGRCGHEDYFKTTVTTALGHLHLHEGRLDKAEHCFFEARELNLRILGEDHPFTHSQASHVALLLLGTGRIEEAEELYVKSIEGLRRTMGEDCRRAIEITPYLATVYIEQGRYDEAEQLLLESLEKSRKLAVNTRHSTSSTSEGLRLKSADALFMNTSTCIGGITDESLKLTSSINHQLYWLYAQLGRTEDAFRLYRDAYENDCRTLGKDHPATLHDLMHLAIQCNEMGRTEEAEEHYRNCLDGCRNTLGEDHWDTCRLKIDLGAFYSNCGRYDEAEPHLTEVVDHIRRRGILNHPMAGSYITMLAMELGSLGLHGDAEEIARLLLERVDQKTPEAVGLKILLEMLNQRYGTQWKDSDTLTSAQRHIALMTNIDSALAGDFLSEGDMAYDRVQELVKVEPEKDLITLYMSSSLEEYNGIGTVLGDARSSSYAVFCLKHGPGLDPVSITYSIGDDDGQVRFTKGLVRHAVVEQYLDRLDGGNEIPDWFVKGQATKFERYFNPQYIKWSVEGTLNPLGGLISPSVMFDTFSYTERQIHSAGLICAYLDHGNPGNDVKAAYENALAAIGRLEGISPGFRKLEEAIAKDEKKIHAFLAAQ